MWHEPVAHPFLKLANQSRFVPAPLDLRFHDSCVGINGRGLPGDVQRTGPGPMRYDFNRDPFLFRLAPHGSCRR